MGILTGWFRGAGPSFAYGIDLSRERVVVAEARRSRRRPAARTFLDSAGAPDELRTSPEAAAMAARILRGEAAVAGAMPAGEATVRWLQTPFGSRRKAMRVLPSLLDIQLPFPLESCRWAFAQVEFSEAGNVGALAVAVRTADIERRLEQLHRCGMDPTVMDHEGLALWEGTGRSADPGADGYRVVFYLAPERVTMVVGDGGRLATAHGMRWSGRATDAAALMPRIGQVLRAQCADDQRSLACWWTGPLAEDAEVVAALEQGLAARPQIRFQSTDDPGSFLARSLAERALASEDPAWNLRTQGLEHPARRRKQDRGDLRRVAAAFLLAVVLMTLNLGWRTALARRNAALDDSLREMAAELTGLPEEAIEPGLALHVARTHLREPGRPQDPFVRSLQGGAAAPVFRAVRYARQARITLHQVEFQQGRWTVRGAASDEESCRQYAALLEQAGVAAALELGRRSPGGRVPFKLSGEYDVD